MVLVVDVGLEELVVALEGAQDMIE